MTVTDVHRERGRGPALPRVRRALPTEHDLYATLPRFPWRRAVVVVEGARRYACRICMGTHGRLRIDQYGIESWATLEEHAAHIDACHPDAPKLRECRDE